MAVFYKQFPPAAATVFLLLCFAVSSRSQSMPGYQAPDKAKDQTPVSVKAARGEAPLSKLYGHLKADASKIKRLEPLKVADKARKSEKEKLFQVGVVRELPSPLNPLTDSTSYVVTEGEVRVAAIISEGARQMRLQFRAFSLPVGARVFVYSASDPNVYFGPYEGRGPWGDGTFWTPPMSGEGVVIEYFAPAGTRSNDVPFTVDQVAHIYKDGFTPDAAGACNLEVPGEWAQVATSVGMLQFVKQGTVALCTGTLLNDSDTSTDHHVLTANHCVSSQDEAQSVTVYWNYTTGDTPPGGTPTTSGANMVTTSVGTDFSLLRLTGALPGGLFF